MSPHAFSFKLTVPNDPAAVPVIAAVVAHAVEFAELDPAKRRAFTERVQSAAEKALANHTHSHSPVEVSAADGRLTVTIGTHAESESLPS
jgi:hypothetical protein